MIARDRRRTILPLLLGGAVLSGGLFISGCGNGEPPEIRGKARIPAERSTISVSIEELGVVESRRVSQINAPFRGRIVYIAETGTQVKQGDVVIRLDTRDITDRLDQRIEELQQIQNQLTAAVEQLIIAVRGNTLDISSSHAQLDLARVELEDVNRNLADLEYLKSREIVSGDEVTRAIFDLQSSQTRTLDRDMQLRAQVTGSQTTQTQREIAMERLGLRGERVIDRINQAQDEIRAAEIRSPTDGVFLRHSRWDWSQRKNTERQAGEEVRFDDILGRIPDLADLYVRAQIPESEMLKVSVGTNVSLNFESIGNTTLPGVITYISPVAIERETSAGGLITASGAELTGEKVFEVHIELQETNTRLRPGLTARTTILIDQRDGILSIPMEAIATRSGVHTVRTWDPAKKALETREVKVGQISGNRVEITEGLNPGELIIM